MSCVVPRMPEQLTYTVLQVLANSGFLDGCTADNVHPPLISVLALSTKEVDVAAVLQLEDMLLTHLVTRLCHCVAQQWKARQGHRFLKGLVEEEAEVAEHHPQFLPSTAVLELAQQVATEVVQECLLVLASANAGVAMPAEVQCSGGMDWALCRIGMPHTFCP